MQHLEALTREAAALARGALPLTADEGEVARTLQICNACRYCEGFCAVFPAMTRRLEFPKADIHYLANLCHNCGACYHACQYAPPHEFAVNIPQAMAKVRVQTYGDYAFPAALGGLYRRAGLTTALALAGGLALFLLMVLAMRGSLLHAPLAGNFYAIFPHNLLAVMFGVVFVFAIFALGIGVTRFWRQVTPGTRASDDGGAAAGGAAHDALRLKYLGGGHGEGCNNEDDAFTLLRRRFHHFTFYGFMLCFAATTVATLYHYLLDLHAPYALTSLPVLLGTVGGIGLLIGTAGLFWLNVRRDPRTGDPDQKPMDRGFIALLFLTSVSGLALLALRDTGAMATSLAVHLGIVMALFLTLPYGKFAHGIYRCAALLKYNIEKRRPSDLALGAD
ncbi:MULTISPECIES: tricarballylate utilization 4Fe-4S protein TcuB [Cupriavidus]|jgi:citrate/tricarballylate utilization protein|uniref:Tricarballylate utilization 4Fe-4S protein TcuB n=1 Tax=Cupriavidus metallidurans TaxID=119219 RepID=A0A2L0X3U9_9BURK|nr:MULTISPECIES: tricarballylate utilization 4Fe-4S protein TcuB [Cupriavidus]AVA34770.1 tricarballylate utilization protein TcuB [Cupriavidus metallidurans]KWR85049.1 tricarballylate utilization protein B [Cupriavidus sp. SHE]QBP12186.1 tricarballylate utilization 4Fe-4S protein TcuB [Cupriavidus metallidurans]QWC92154.1 tricarballylate utilization 4Fe-4S protein TcuB [Cupriavidus metallidurans]